MLRFLTPPQWHKGQFTRREWLRIGGLYSLGLGVNPHAAAAGKARSSSSSFGRARSVILVYTSGGMSHIDTIDPKPDAPAEVRGEFRSIPTAINGVRFCEHLPRLAQKANLCTIVRSVNHEDRDHGSATYLALTGQYHVRRSGNPPVNPLADLPTYGSVVQKVRPIAHFPYTAIHVNGPAQIPAILAPGQFAGFLGGSCEPLLIGDPTQESASVRAMEDRAELPPIRQEARRSLLETLDGYSAKLQQTRPATDMHSQYRKAYDLLSSKQGRQAFDLAQEPARTRDSYGRFRSGQSLLLARRLVEAGVPWITVIWNHCNRGQDKDPGDSNTYGWDTHNDIFGGLKRHLLPRFDQSIAALLGDLEQRGLLDQTLVVCMGEFGRAPQIAVEPGFAGDYPGRKHWPSVYSIIAAGAGVQRGAVFGASDRIGAYPHSNPIGPWDVAATMFHALGLDPDGHYIDPTGRPLALTTGKPIAGLYGG
ncbi:MAG: DUF1501 domain-containing protein [Gemmataceae bacterium]|nr:DUF1501 domain-containing protein [Gemmataceae bacterium]